MNDIKLATTSELLNLVGSTDPQQVIGATQELALRHEMTSTTRLIEILRSSSDVNIRNAVALALSDLQAPEAFNVLVDLLKDDLTRTSRGTLLYALGSYDCSPILTLLVELVIEGNFEVSRQSLSLISGIEAEVNEQEWNICIDKLKAALLSASQERRPLLVELLSLFEQEQ